MQELMREQGLTPKESRMAPARTILALAALCAAAVTAQAQAVSLLDLKVQDLQASYEIGRPIKLTPASPPPASLHVRIFPGRISELKRVKADSDGCIPYFTSMIWGMGQAHIINLSAINDRNFLKRDGSGRWIPNTVTLVFEAGDQVETGAFRLKKAALTAYFQHAVEITLVPSADEPQVQAMVASKVLLEMHAIEDNHGSPAPTLTRAPSRTALPCYSVSAEKHNTEAEIESASGVELVATAVPVGCGMPDNGNHVNLQAETARPAA